MSFMMSRREIIVSMLHKYNFYVYIYESYNYIALIFKLINIKLFFVCTIEPIVKR